MKRLINTTSIFALSFSSAMLLASAQPTLASQAEIDAITAKYEAEFAELKAEMNEWQSQAPDYSDADAMIGVSGTIDWEITDFSFDIPEIIFKTRELSLDLPQFKWDRTSFSMDFPEVFMAVTKVGEYPCINKLQVRMCDIKTDVPQVRMVRKEYSLDLPQVWWDRTSFSMDIPEFFSKRVEIKMHLPQFTVEDVDAEINAYQDEGELFAARSEELGNAQKEEIEHVVVSDLNEQKAAVSAQFVEAIAALDKAIVDLTKVGVDPTSVQTPEGTIDLVALRVDVLAKRDDALAQIDEHLAKLTA